MRFQHHDYTRRERWKWFPHGRYNEETTPFCSKSPQHKRNKSPSRPSLMCFHCADDGSRFTNGNLLQWHWSYFVVQDKREILKHGWRWCDRQDLSGMVGYLCNGVWFVWVWEKACVHIGMIRIITDMDLCINYLTHWGGSKMAAIFQTTSSNAFSWMKVCEFRLGFHWILFLRVQ